jgi:hypothetical protein
MLVTGSNAGPRQPEQHELLVQHQDDGAFRPDLTKSRSLLH